MKYIVHSTVEALYENRYLISHYCWFHCCHVDFLSNMAISQMAMFMGPTWGNLGPVGPRWALCWPHEPCYQDIHYESSISWPRNWTKLLLLATNVHICNKCLTQGLCMLYVLITELSLHIHTHRYIYIYWNALCSSLYWCYTLDKCTMTDNIYAITLADRPKE